MPEPVRIGGFFANFDTEAVLSQLTLARQSVITKLDRQGVSATAASGSLLGTLNEWQFANRQHHSNRLRHKALTRRTCLERDFERNLQRSAVHEHERHRDPNANAATVDVELFVKPFDAERDCRRKLRLPDGQAFDRLDLHHKRVVALGNRATIDVQSIGNLELHGQPDSLAPCVCVLVKPPTNGYAFRLRLIHGAVSPSLQTEEMLQHTDARVALTVAGVKVFTSHGAVLIQDERSGVRDAENRFSGRLIEDAEGTDHLAAFIRKQGVVNAVLLGEAVEDLDAVVADGIEGEASGLKFGADALQLNELRFAERSPARASMENHECWAPRPVGVQINRFPIHSRKHEIWKWLTNCGPELFEINV